MILSKQTRSFNQHSSYFEDKDTSHVDTTKGIRDNPVSLVIDVRQDLRSLRKDLVYKLQQQEMDKNGDLTL